MKRKLLSPIFVGVFCFWCVVLAQLASAQTFTVTPSAGTGGSLSPDALQTVTTGATTTFTVTPETGYHIDTVTGCDGALSGDTYTTGAITADCTVTASFAVNTYTVTPLAGAHGTITPNTPQTVLYNGTTTFTVSEDAGYYIDSVTGCGGSRHLNYSDQYTTGPITADCTVSASFSPLEYEVRMGREGWGSGTISPRHQYTTYGATVSFTVTPNAGSHIARVTGLDGGCGVGSLNGNTYTTGPITNFCSVYARFDLNTYTVTPLVATGNGTFAPSTPQTVIYNETTTFTVSPDTGYYLGSVTGCGGSLNDDTYTTGPITADCTVSASFSPLEYEVYTGREGWGSGTISPRRRFTTYGATVSFTVTPNAGSHIAWVTEDPWRCGGGSLNGNTYTTGPIRANLCSVLVRFDLNTPHTVTPLAGLGGALSPNLPQTVDYDATLSLLVTPDAGYHIDTVTGCAGALSGNTYTTGPITADCTVTASFAVNTNTVTPLAGAHGTISPNTSQTVNEGTTTSFTITPETGYHLDTVTGCGGALSGNTYTTGAITADCTVTATFNATPVAANDTYGTAEDTALTIAAPGVLANDTDGEDDPLTVTLATTASHGTLSFNADGSLTYTPNANWNGLETFTYTVNDGGADSAPATVEITVTAVNDPPVNTVAPGITGVLLVDDTVTAQPGVWNDALDTDVSGVSTITFAEQWQRANDRSGAGAVDIPGATDSAYTVTAADSGKYLRLKVTATDTGVGTPPNQSAAAYSAWSPAMTAEFTVAPSGVSVAETGATAALTVVLTAQPGADVVFTITGSDPTEATVSPATLTFTAGNWSTAQTVTVTGVNDTLQDGAQTSTVTVSVDDARSDNAFAGLADQTVTVTTSDNDTFLTTDWEDANKNGPDDSDLCWAAAAANLLAWGGWNAGFSGSQTIFDAFEAHWTNASSRMYDGWRWWLDGTAPGQRAAGAKVDVSGAGGYYQGNYSSAFYVSSMAGPTELLLNTLSTAFEYAFGAIIGLLNTASADTHALTVWGYDTDNLGDLLGLYVTDSDDGVNQLVYYAVDYNSLTSYWTLTGTDWYIRELDALGTYGGATNAATFGSSGTITGQRYGDGGIKTLTAGQPVAAPTTTPSARNETPQPIPEPASLILVSLGLLGLLSICRSRRPW